MDAGLSKPCQGVAANKWISADTDSELSGEVIMHERRHEDSQTRCHIYLQISTAHCLAHPLRHRAGMATPHSGESSAVALQIGSNVSDDERFSTLAPYELSWRRRQPWLQSRGYMLRPRYRPGWVPSWRTTGANPIDCEDSVDIGVCGVLPKLCPESIVLTAALLGISTRH